MIDLRQKGLASHWLVGIFAGLMGFVGISHFDHSDRTFDDFDDVSLCYHVPLNGPYDASKDLNHSPVLDKSFVAFKEALAFKESRGDYQAINRLGYLGKYQFHMNTLALLGIHDKQRFLEQSELQEQAFFWYAARNKWILRKDIKWFVGTKINNIVVTESGIIAAAHLAGPGNVKKFLRSGGEFNSKDAFGTSISMYMEYFKNYDLSMIEAVRKPKI